MTELLLTPQNYDCDGIDPDPLTLLLTWLGAVGLSGSQAPKFGVSIISACSSVHIKLMMLQKNRS